MKLLRTTRPCEPVSEVIPPSAPVDVSPLPPMKLRASANAPPMVTPSAEPTRMPLTVFPKAVVPAGLSPTKFPAMVVAPAGARC